MPAVDLPRIKRQIHDLLDYFHAPAAFRRELNHLFFNYAHHALNFSDYSKRKPLIPSYHLPAPLIRQLEMDLRPVITQYPQAALALADELWQDTYIEVQKTAIFILNTSLTDNPAPIRERLETWLTPEMDKELAAYLITQATKNLLIAFPKAWEKLVETWLDQKQPRMTAIGLQAVIESVKNPNYSNLPFIYRLVSPFIQEPHSIYRHELELLITALVERSPTETGFFILQVLALSPSKSTRRLVKDCLPAFSQTIQQELQLILKD
jgi:hypothetical protein